MPTAHAYVRNLVGVQSGSDAVVRLPDPVPPGAGATGRWWPPRWLDPEWLSAHVADFDIMHVHFGFDAMPVERLRDVVAVLRENGKPLVFTVHDLHNPHFPDNTLHRAHLDVLIPAATELITLTAGAAAEIFEVWKADATVVPHPHVAPLSSIGRGRRSKSEFVIGVHAKSLRANLDPIAVIETVVAQAGELPGTTVRIDIDDNVFGADAAPAITGIGDALRAYGARTGVDVRVHPRFDDAELWQYLRDIDVSVLPYRFGTHSGWMEACHDMGTATIVPDCGYFSEQQPSRAFGFGIGRFDPHGLAAAVRAAHADRNAVPHATEESRTLQREHISRLHHRIYARAMTSVAAAPSDDAR